MNQGHIELLPAAQRVDLSLASDATPRVRTPAFCPKRKILVGLVKLLAVGCGLNECSLQRTSVDDFSEIIVCARALPDSNRQLHPDHLAEHLLESVNTVKPLQNPISQHKTHRQAPAGVNSCVLHQTHYPGGLG